MLNTLSLLFPDILLRSEPSYQAPVISESNISPGEISSLSPAIAAGWLANLAWSWWCNSIKVAVLMDDVHV